MVRAMCGQKVVDRKTTEEQMDMLGLKETIDQLATANGVRWYRHVLRRDDDSVLKKKNALRQDKWRDGVQAIAKGMG